MDINDKRKGHIPEPPNPANVGKNKVPHVFCFSFQLMIAETLVLFGMTHDRLALFWIFVFKYSWPISGI